MSATGLPMVQQHDRVDLEWSPTARAITWLGVAVGLILALVMAMAIVSDRRARLEAAEREASALARGAQRLVWLELRNLKRALQGIAADAAHWPADADGLAEEMVASMRGVARRQPEFESLLVVDAGGRALGGGEGDATLPAWYADGGDALLAVGPLQRRPSGWVLPMAVPMGDGRHVLGRLRVEELHDLVSEVAPPGQAVVRVTDGRRRIVADNRGLARVGHAAEAWRTPEQFRQPVVWTAGVDGAPRLVVDAKLPGFPLHVTVGMTRAAILQRWWTWVGIAVLFQLLYWLALAYVILLARQHVRTRTQLIARLAETAQGLRQAQELGRTGTWSSERDTFVDWSPQLGQLFGVPPGAGRVPFSVLYERMHPEDRDRVQALFHEAWTTGKPFAIDYRMRDPEGREHWLSVRGACVPGSEDVPRMRGTVIDISDRMEVMQQLRDANSRFRMLFERNPLPCWVFDVETLRFLEVNATAVEHYGYSREEFLAMTVLDIRPQEDRAAARADADGPVRRDGLLWRHLRKDGSLLQVRVYAVDVEFDGRPARIVLAEDVTQRLALQEELAWRAHHDARTGLLNADAVAEALQTRGVDDYGVAYVQLRGVELVEDSLGRQAGEAIVREVATRLHGLGTRYGMAGHVRGDEMVLVVERAAELDAAVDALRSALAEPVTGRDLRHPLEYWLGTARAPEAGSTPAQVIANAGVAAHASGREGMPVVRFAPRLAQGASDRLRMAGRLHRAIDAREFTLHYQLIRRMRDGQPAAIEALLRWPQAGGGFVPPDEFIRIAEDTGLIVPLGRWVLREAAQAQRRLADAGMDVPIAVNVSLAQCLHEDLAADLEGVLGRHGLARGALHVELTESILMTRPDELAQMLQRLRALGVCVALDDFGTGFSSMAYLRHLPLDKLKIDRAFITNVHEDPRSASICSALLAMGHSLGLVVVAEGVETQAQFDWLAARGCDQVQGFGMDRPVALEDALARMQAHAGDIAPVAGARWARAAQAGHAR